MRVRKISPVLLVDEIESCLDFWSRLGFEKTVEVPEGDQLGFVILRKDDVEIMYQSRASITGDIPPLADTPGRGAFLFIEVDDIDEVDQILLGTLRVIPRRTTFYGADEVIVREPGGHVVAFAQMKNPQ